jgi:hypothetical protein
MAFFVWNRDVRRFMFRRLCALARRTRLDSQNGNRQCEKEQASR